MVLVFKRGDDFLEELKNKLDEPGVSSAFFYGLGGFLEADLAFYDLDKKEYITKSFKKGPYEVLSIVGNVSEKDGEIMIHCHTVLGKKNYTAVGGHLMRGVVGGTLELHLTKIDNKLKRSLDEDTGLHTLTN